MMEIYIKRPKYFQQIIPLIQKDIIKVFIGQRRVGKSKLMLQTIDYLRQDLGIDSAEIVYIDKENIAFDYIRDYESLYMAVQGFSHIFIDEIQNIVDWEKAVLSLQNE
jgi:predicted AAA+ superfamily ATPase